jgi:hypothetical protein
MTHITTADVLRQLKADLIGKDSYRGVTLTYSWMANQFGHFSLGFIPTLIVHTILVKKPWITNPELYAALGVSAMWLLFELYNFLGPLLLKQIHKSSSLTTKGVKYTFKPSWGNIAFDTFTDLCFFWLGAFSAARLLGDHFIVPYVLIALLLMSVYPVYYWFLTKMYLQTALYPYQFRLSQWDYDISDDNRKIVEGFVNSSSTGKHLFIYGQRNSGKTGISIGMATEMSIKHHTCSYTTAMKLYNLFEPDKGALSTNNALWTWANSSVLVIDDINPCYPQNLQKELITPDEFLQFLDTFSAQNDVNRTIIKNKNVIWVLGGECSDDMHGKWREMLLKIGVKSKDLKSITLSTPTI